MFLCSGSEWTCRNTSISSAATARGSPLQQAAVSAAPKRAAACCSSSVSTPLGAEKDFGSISGCGHFAGQPGRGIGVGKKFAICWLTIVVLLLSILVRTLRLLSVVCITGPLFTIRFVV